MRSISATCTADSRSQSTNCSRSSRERPFASMRTHHSAASARVRARRLFASMIQHPQQVGIQFGSQFLVTLHQVALDRALGRAESFGNLCTSQAFAEMQLEDGALP